MPYYNLPIRKYQLQYIIETLYLQVPSKHKKFISIWKDFIAKYANDSLFFADKNCKIQGNETYQYNMSYINQDFAIYFNIQRISQFISTNNIRYYSIKLSDIINQLYYTKEESIGVREKINNYPIIIYFPISHLYLKYITIDGNHRITYYTQNNLDCKLTLIKPYDLRLSCFYDFNSWIIYHFLTNYYGITNNNDCYIDQFINKSISLINSVIPIISSQDQ